MRVAISTCQTGMIESLSAMFSEHEIHILGIMRPRLDWQFYMGVERGKFGRNVYNHFQDEEPVEKLEVSEYDLLIDVAESNDYNSEWRETAVKWHIPRIIYITNPAPKTRAYWWFEKHAKRGLSLAKKLVHLSHPIFQYYKEIGNYPIVYSNETLQRDWALWGEVIHFTSDEWSVGNWIGDEPKMLYGKNGYYTWSRPEGTPFATLFSKLEKRFGDKLIVHDSSKKPMSEWDWRNCVAHKRLWFEHDFGSSGRAITQGVVKAMCLGLPVILWKTDITQVWRFINGRNGIATRSVDEVVEFANKLFEDYDLAKQYSKEMVRVYKDNLSWAAAKPKWENAMKKAFEYHERRQNNGH